ncbi:MAG TPA: anti-sigma factor [Streptosporangiaceae bacterium]|nr:anti-sigma factor [Streptosporangiaceae bacterium]
MTSGDHLHTLSGAYVLDAISDDERAAFTAHLADCGPCRDEVRELREATARLGTSQYLWPRPELRGHTIRAATMTSQLGPVISAHDQAAPDAAALVATRAPVWRRLALAAAAVVVAAGVGFGVVMHDTMQTLHHSQRQNQLIAAVLNAPDAVMRTARVGTGMARVVMSHRRHMGVFMAYRLPSLPRADRYELWLMGPLGDRPAGMLRTRPGGMAGPAVISGMAYGDMIALTVEPADGSRMPTSAPLVLIGP